MKHPKNRKSIPNQRNTLARQIKTRNFPQTESNGNGKLAETKQKRKNIAGHAIHSFIGRNASQNDVKTKK